MFDIRPLATVLICLTPLAGLAEAPAKTKAGDAHPGSTAAKGGPSGNVAPSIPELIKQLDADEFARREEASRRLAELGTAAVPDVAQAALQPSAEVSARAFAVLKTFIEADDEALRAKARDALKAIAAKREAAEKNQDAKLAAIAATATSILGKPFLGVFGGGIDEGAMVADVVQGSPAEKTGLQPGDVIISFGGVPTPTFPDLVAAVGEKEPGDRAKLEIERDGEKRELDVVVGRLGE